ncbi:hypothetical protein BEWA_018730 [Theileria equi strain WA]|uniref:Uncharacterized protein n=1 Tax=Theileria equi strain WA TaxID=1537102 RepID=L0AUW3_THEEQ|nr:hypothetical protein BEWA_018730 [Theileria equi strain WA]AFZ79028.1 hypothetical protein BEWA_018730 [Theileria equi strain WA]|eukprot:XP_004828694.1 hypothetical protein BEWA_018730 [Theileria equi strain WA]
MKLSGRGFVPYIASFYSNTKIYPCILNSKLHNSTRVNGIYNEICLLRYNTSCLRKDISFLTSSSLKSAGQKLQLKLRDCDNDDIKSIALKIYDKTHKVDKLVYKILNNRYRYNLEKTTKVFHDSNYKYGLVGVSFICFFGSLTLSLSPVFSIGCLVGLYLYRNVYKQTVDRRDANLNFEKYIADNKIQKSELAFTLKLMLYDISLLERNMDIDLPRNVEYKLN